MNMAHIHLILNHVPSIAIPVALVFLIHSLWTANTQSRKFAYIVLLVASIAVIPVYLSGERAEDIVEKISGISENLIEEHEEAASVSLALTLLAGAGAFFGILAGNGNKAKIAQNLVVATSVIAVGSLMYTANLGGKIRHPEITDQVNVQQSIEQGSGQTENED